MRHRTNAIPSVTLRMLPSLCHTVFLELCDISRDEVKLLLQAIQLVHGDSLVNRKRTIRHYIVRLQDVSHHTSVWTLGNFLRGRVAINWRPSKTTNPPHQKSRDNLFPNSFSIPQSSHFHYFSLAKLQCSVNVNC